MSSAIKELSDKFSIDLILFIVVTGLLFVAFFPFDILSYDFSNGILISDVSPDKLDFTAWLNSTKNNFHPGILLQHAGYFPNGLIQLFLFSLIPGLLIFTLQKPIEWVNGKTVKSFRRGEKALRKNIEKKMHAKLFFNVEGADDAERALEGIRLYKWIKKNGLLKRMYLICTLSYLPLGCLFAFEVLTAISFVSFMINFVSSLLSWVDFSWLLLYWTTIFIALTILTYFTYLFYHSYVCGCQSGCYDAYKLEVKKQLEAIKQANTQQANSPKNGDSPTVNLVIGDSVLKNKINRRE